MTGVAGPSGCVRSTTDTVPRARASTSCAKTSRVPISASDPFRRAAGVRGLRRDPALETEGVLRKLQVHAVVIGTGRGNPGHDDAEIVARERLDGGLAERHHRVHGG